METVQSSIVSESVALGRQHRKLLQVSIAGFEPLSNLIFRSLFTKILAPYGRYLGFWKSNRMHCGGLVQVTLNLTDQTIVGEEINAIDRGQDDFGFYPDETDSTMEPIYPRSKLFTIDLTSGNIFCHECEQAHASLPWNKTFDSGQPYFGLSQEALPVAERASLVSRNSINAANPDERDIYFIRNCEPESPIVYRPLSIPESKTGPNDHPLARFNGIWVGTYGGHGLEILHLECREQFSCPITADGVAKEVEIVPMALVATKISGDLNVPHGEISFAAVRPNADQPESGLSYDGIGQSKSVNRIRNSFRYSLSFLVAQTYFVEPQFIRTKVILISENLLKVTWFALHHTSSFKRCQFWPTYTRYCIFVIRITKDKEWAPDLFF